MWAFQHRPHYLRSVHIKEIGSLTICGSHVPWKGHDGPTLDSQKFRQKNRCNNFCLKTSAEPKGFSEAQNPTVETAALLQTNGFERIFRGRCWMANQYTQ